MKSMRALVTQSGPSLPQVSRLEAIGTPPSLSTRRVAKGSTCVTRSTAFASKAAAIDSVSLNHTMLKSLVLEPVRRRARGRAISSKVLRRIAPIFRPLPFCFCRSAMRLDAARALREQEQTARAAAADDAHRRAVVRRDDDVGERDVHDLHARPPVSAVSASPGLGMNFISTFSPSAANSPVACA